MNAESCKVLVELIDLKHSCRHVITMLEGVLVILAIILVTKIYLKLICAVCKSKICLVDKVAIVTGGSSGIGYETVLGLASRGCKVIVADVIVNPSIRDRLIEATNNPNIILKYVDLASFQSVRKFAEEIRNSEDRIDILIHNAGTGFGNDRISEDNLNLCVQVNYYSSFLLTHLLIGLLKKSLSGRIIWTSSIIAMIVKPSVQEIASIKIKRINYSYAISKYYVLVASDIFAEKLKGTGITSNCYHPGAVFTPIFRKSMNDSLRYYYNVIVIVMLFFTYLVGKSPEEGAQVPIHLACASEVKTITGDFFYETSSTFRPLGTKDSDVKEAIWKISEDVVQLEASEKL